MTPGRLYRRSVQERINDGIKDAFSWPFYAGEQCKPDNKSHRVADRTFHLNGYFVALYNIQIFPGINFRALKSSTGELNTFTQDVIFEVNIPTIGGYFYIVSEDKNAKPVHVRGSFKIKYGTAIAKGINTFYLDGKHLNVQNIALDFELKEKPRVTLYSHETDGSMSEFDSDKEGNAAKIAELMWPNVHSRIYMILRDKLSQVSWRIQWSVRYGREEFTFYETRRREKVSRVMYEIIMKLRKKLREKTNAGRLPMPDIDVMVAQRKDRDVWGRFKATSGWLGNIATIGVNDETAVHANSDNELVIVAQVDYPDLKYCYDEYTMEGNTGSAKGNIVGGIRTEAFITIKAVRSEEGVTILKEGRFEYINSGEIFNSITQLGDFEWMKRIISVWMYGVIAEEKPNLNKIITDCLNEVIVDVDLFEYWDELKAEDCREENSPDSSDDEVSDYETENSWTENSEEHYSEAPDMAWECYL